MNSYNHIIQKLVNVVDKAAPNSEVYLYGSRARGVSKPLSDWDLLILLNKSSLTFEFETQLMDAFYDIEIETGEVFSPLIYTKQDWTSKHSLTPLFSNIQNEGIRIK